MISFDLVILELMRMCDLNLICDPPLLWLPSLPLLLSPGRHQLAARARAAASYLTVVFIPLISFTV
jgi:hypothetical protein